MTFNEIIGLFDNLIPKTSGYNINKNSLIDIDTLKNYKFNKIVKHCDLYNLYKNEMINFIKNNSKYIESEKIKTSFVLFGKSFSDEYTFIDLINNLIDEFILEHFPFYMSIYEVNSIGTFDLVSNKYFKYYDDTINSSKIYFEPLNNNFFEVLYDTLDKIAINYKMKTIGSHIFVTFENIYQKVRIYNLEDLNIKSKKILSMDSLFIKSETSNLFSLLNNSLNKNNSILTKMLDNDLKTDVKVKVLFRFCKKIKLLNLTSAFYNNFQIKNKTGQLVLYKEIDPIQKYDFNINKFNQPFNINNMTTKYKIIKPILNHQLNKASNSIIKYIPKTQIKSTIRKETKVITPKEYTETQKPMEIIKIFNLFNDQKLINDKLRVLNKFIFDSTVKNQLKLQISNKDPIRMNEINGDVLTNLKSILTVVLDQLNEI
jgi:hypothetical protein